MGASAEHLEIVHQLKHHRDGSVSFYIRDPDGNVIQALYEPTISPQFNSLRNGRSRSAQEKRIDAERPRDRQSYGGIRQPVSTCCREISGRCSGSAISSIGIGTYLGEPDDETDRALRRGAQARRCRRDQSDRYRGELSLPAQRTEDRQGHRREWSRRARSRARRSSSRPRAATSRSTAKCRPNPRAMVRRALCAQTGSSRPAIWSRARTA